MSALNEAFLWGLLWVIFIVAISPSGKRIAALKVALVTLFVLAAIPFVAKVMR